MLEKHLRSYYQFIFADPIAKKIRDWSSLSPSHITIIGCLIGILSGVAIGFGSLWIALSSLFLSGYLDTLDGTLARLKNQSSPVGGALDIVSDRVVEFSIIFGLYALHAETRAIFSLFMLGSILICVTSFLVVGIFSENTSQKSFYYSQGLIERGEAFLFFTLMIILPNSFPLLAIIFSLLVTLTAMLHLYQFAQNQR